MIIGAIEGHNMLMLGDREQGVADLPVIRDEENGTFTSAWFPTPHEMELIAQGHPVLLTFYSATHPPVYLGVKE